jgi:hypothetical protein
MKKTIYINVLVLYFNKVKLDMKTDALFSFFKLRLLLGDVYYNNSNNVFEINTYINLLKSRS